MQVVLALYCYHHNRVCTHPLTCLLQYTRASLQVIGALGKSSSLPFHTISQYVRSRLSASQSDLHRLYLDCCSVTNSIDLFMVQQIQERSKELGQKEDGSNINKSRHQPQYNSPSGPEGTAASAQAGVMERRKWSDIRRNLMDAASDHEAFFAVSKMDYLRIYVNM